MENFACVVAEIVFTKQMKLCKFQALFVGIGILIIRRYDNYFTIPGIRR